MLFVFSARLLTLKNRFGRNATYLEGKFKPKKQTNMKQTTTQHSTLIMSQLILVLITHALKLNAEFGCVSIAIC